MIQKCSKKIDYFYKKRQKHECPRCSRDVIWGRTGGNSMAAAGVLVFHNKYFVSVVVWRSTFLSRSSSSSSCSTETLGFTRLTDEPQRKPPAGVFIKLGFRGCKKISIHIYRHISSYNMVSIFRNKVSIVFLFIYELELNFGIKLKVTAVGVFHLLGSSGLIRSTNNN